MKKFFLAFTALVMLAILIVNVTNLDINVLATTQQLFDDNSGNFYNYCPSYIQTSSTERYIYYCKNENSGQIVDTIYWRKATLSGSTWTWGSQNIALQTSSSGWDDVHVCDPDVKAGSFDYNNHTYSYVMFYLGCDQLDNCHNQIGVAFSDSLEGPWVKYSANPIISYSNTTQWGVGQPSATSIDGQGQLLLFYTKGDNWNDISATGVFRRQIDLSDMSSPTIGTAYEVFRNGLTSADSSALHFHNVGVAYDNITDRFYIIRDRGPAPSTDPTFIDEQLQIAYTSGTEMWSNSGSWTIEGHIAPSVTGKDRNHNATILTNQYGVIIGGANNYEMAFTGSMTGVDYGLWTYRIYSATKVDLVMNPVPTATPTLAPTPTATPTPTSTSAPIDSGSLYKLINRQTQNVLDCWDSTNGSSAYTWDWTTVYNQQWYITDIGSGYYKIINRWTDNALDCYGLTDGSDVYTWDYVAGIDQKWQVIGIGDGYYKIINVKSGLAMQSVGTADGSNVYASTYDGSASQQWELVKLP